MTQRHVARANDKAASRRYRFVRLDARRVPTEELTLICSSDEDALTVGGHLGSDVEIWDGARPIGHAGGSPPNAIAPPPALEPPGPGDFGPTAPRAFNPFRRDAWRRRG